MNVFSDIQHGFRCFIDKCYFGLLLLFLTTNFISAQPISFTISGCSVAGGAVNGDYTQSATDVNSCPCIGFVPTIPLYEHGGDPCDISVAIIRSVVDCDPATTLSNIQYATPDVPTLSEWGLLNLALLLIICGTLSLMKENKLEQNLNTKNTL